MMPDQQIGERREKKGDLPIIYEIHILDFINWSYILITRKKRKRDHENLRQMRTNIMGIHNHFNPAKAQ